MIFHQKQRRQRPADHERPVVLYLIRLLHVPLSGLHALQDETLPQRVELVCDGLYQVRHLVRGLRVPEDVARSVGELAEGDLERRHPGSDGLEVRANRVGVSFRIPRLIDCDVRDLRLTVENEVGRMRLAYLAAYVDGDVLKFTAFSVFMEWVLRISWSVKQRIAPQNVVERFDR